MEYGHFDSQGIYERKTMIQYNLRLDKKLKNKAKLLAEQEGMSENLLYNKAIEDYVRRREQEEFVGDLFKRKVSDSRIRSIFAKIKKSKRAPLYEEDRV